MTLVRLAHERAALITKKRFVIYTAIFDDYDSLAEPSVWSDEIDYVFFTNSEREISTDSRWIKVGLSGFYRDPRRTARILKCFAHRIFPHHERSIWIDGSCKIKGDVIFLLKSASEHALYCFDHPNRNCAYDEAVTCISSMKDDYKVISEQMIRYRTAGYPPMNGLIASGVLIRDHKSVHLDEMMRSWFQEIDLGSSRDQLSFNYVMWKLSRKWGVIKGSIMSNSYFLFRSHAKWKFYDSAGRRILSPRILVSRFRYRVGRALATLLERFKR